MGFSFITGQETVVHADNASFDGTERAGRLLVDGQLWIGSSALPHVVKSTLTAGSGVTITNGSGTITIAAGASVPTTFTTDSGNAIPSANILNILGGSNVTTSGSGNTVTINVSGGMAWTEETASPVSAVINHGYIANLGSLLTFNLPATFAIGDIIHIVGKGAGLWRITASTGDTIQFGNQVTSSGGTITGTNAFDTIQIIGTTANSVWTCTGVSQGNLTVA